MQKCYYYLQQALYWIDFNKKKKKAAAESGIFAKRVQVISL